MSEEHVATREIPKVAVANVHDEVELMVTPREEMAARAMYARDCVWRDRSRSWADATTQERNAWRVDARFVVAAVDQVS